LSTSTKLSSTTSLSTKDQLKSVDESSDVVDKNLGIDIITDSVSKMGFNRIQNHATSSQKKGIDFLACFFFLPSIYDTFNSSTSNTSVELGGIQPGTPLAP